MRLAGDLVQLAAPEDVETAEEAVRVLLPLVLDATTEGLVDFALSTLERVLGSAESDAFAQRLYYRLFSQCHQISSTFEEEIAAKTTDAAAVSTGAATSSNMTTTKRRRKSASIDDSAAGAVPSPTSLDERILHEIFKFLEMNLDRAPLQDAIAQFYAARYVDTRALYRIADSLLFPYICPDSRFRKEKTPPFTSKIAKITTAAMTSTAPTSTPTSLLSLLLSSGNEKLSPGYGNKVLKFFNRLFQLVNETCPSSGWTGCSGGGVGGIVGSRKTSVDASSAVVPPPPAPPAVLLPPYASLPILPAPPNPLVHPLVQLCSSMTTLGDIGETRLSAWLSTLILGRNVQASDKEATVHYGAPAAGSPEDEMFSSASSSLAFTERRSGLRVNDDLRCVLASL